MLFKPDLTVEAGPTTAPRRSGGAIATVMIVTVLGGLGYLGWRAVPSKPVANRHPNVAVPVLAARPRTEDVPVYLEGVGSVRALNTVTVRPQVDGKLIAVNFSDGQDVRKGDVLGEIDPVIYKAQYDQAVAKKAQDEALLANQRLDLIRYQQLASANAGSKQQADTQRAIVAQQEALVNSDQAAIDNAQATLGYTRIIAPLSGRVGLRQVDEGNIIHAADTTGLAIITELRPIAVQFSLPQQQIMRVNAAAAKAPLAVDVFGNDGVTVVDTGTLKGIDNQVDPTTGTLKLKAEFPNAHFQLWPGQFVNVRLKVDTLTQALVVPTSAVQRGPAGTFSYVIGEDDTVTATPVAVTQQNENDAVIASGLSAGDRVVTSGFASLSEGAKVSVDEAGQTPSPDLAPRKRRGSRDLQANQGQVREFQAREGRNWAGRGREGQGGSGDARSGDARSDPAGHRGWRGERGQVEVKDASSSGRAAEPSGGGDGAKSAP
jgi:multidrug efflux system membrane fusion protein